jgi:hypothetical protein
MPISQIVTNSIANGAVVEVDIADGAVTNAKIGTMAATKLTGRVAAANAPSGSVIQVVQFSTTATGTVGNSAAQAPGPFQATITPTSTSSRILVQITAHIGMNDNDSRYTGFWVRRNGTDIVVGNKGGNNGTNVSFTGNFQVGNVTPVVTQANFVYLDSPNSTSALTYALWWQADFIGGPRINYFNRPDNLSDAMRLWTPSSMVLSEIAG